MLGTSGSSKRVKHTTLISVPPKAYMIRKPKRSSNALAHSSATGMARAIRILLLRSCSVSGDLNSISGMTPSAWVMVAPLARILRTTSSGPGSGMGRSTRFSPSKSHVFSMTQACLSSAHLFSFGLYRLEMSATVTDQFAHPVTAKLGLPVNAG